jgi:hypothetical protein
MMKVRVFEDLTWKDVSSLPLPGIVFPAGYEAEVVESWPYGDEPHGFVRVVTPDGKQSLWLMNPEHMEVIDGEGTV